MIHITIGFLTAWVILGIFHLIHRQTKLKKQHYIYFFMLCMLGSYVVESYEHLWIWFGFLFLSYTYLDDFLQTSIYISLPIWLSLCFYFFDGNPYSVFWVIGFFVLFHIFDAIWTKYISENFDIIFLFPLSYLCFFDKNEWVAFAVFLSLIVFSFLSKESFIGQGDAFFALPILYFLEPELYISFFLMSCFVALPFAVHQFLFKEETDFPFTPYLLGGFILTYADNAILSLSLLFCSIIGSLLLWIFFRIKNRG